MKRKLSPWCKEVKKTLIDRDMSVTELCGEVALALYLGKIKKHTGTAPGVKELQELTKDNYWG